MLKFVKRFIYRKILTFIPFHRVTVSLYRIIAIYSFIVFGREKSSCSFGVIRIQGDNHNNKKMALLFNKVHPNFNYQKNFNAQKHLFTILLP